MTYRSSTVNSCIAPVDHLDVHLKTVGEVPGCLVVCLKGYLDTYNGCQFQRQMESVIGNGYTRLVFDFAGLTYISSGPITAFVDLLKQVKSEGGDVVLASMPPRVMEVFDLLGLASFFRVAESVAEGVDLFDRGPQGPEAPFQQMDAITGSFRRLELFVPKEHHPALYVELVAILKLIDELKST